MFYWRKGVELFFLAVFILFFSGCFGKKQVGVKDSVNFRIDCDPSTLDPAYVVDVKGGNISSKIFNGLVRFNEKMIIVGDLAEKIDVSEDGLRYVFHLRKGVKFHCGKEFSAKDVVFSFKRILSEKTNSPRKRILSSIKGVDDWNGKGEIEGLKVVDKYTVEIMLSKPNGVFLSLLSMPSAYIVCSKCMGNFGRCRTLCGTGPYKLKKWEREKKICLEVNNLYFGKKPRGFRYLNYYVIPEDFTALAEARNKRIDIMEVTSSLFPIAQKENGKMWNIKEGVTLSTYYIGMNCAKGVFKNKEIRKAVACAVNKDEIIDSIMAHTVLRANGPIPPPLAGNLKKEMLKYDPDFSKKICKKYDLKELEIKFYSKSSKENVDIISAIVSQLENVGFKVKMELRDWTRFKEAVNEGKADLFFLSWWADIPDGIDFLYPTFHSSNFGPKGNRCFYKNEEVDKMIEKALKAYKPEEKEVLYKNIAEKVVADCPWVFLWHKKSYYIVSKKVKGFKVFPMYNMDKGEDYSLLR